MSLIHDAQAERISGHKRPESVSTWTEQELDLAEELVGKAIRGEFKLKDIYTVHENEQIFGDKSKGSVQRKIKSIKAKLIKGE